jgi:hypothetical protein
LPRGTEKNQEKPQSALLVFWPRFGPKVNAVEAHRVDTSRLTHFLDDLLVDGGKGVSLTHWPPFTPRKIPGPYFC